jgi:photosystem II stability/assembly factor-like uncharacterized protein
MRISQRKLVLPLVLLVGLVFGISPWNTAQNRATKNEPTVPNLATRSSSNLKIRNKLGGAERKAASAKWFMSQRMYGLGYIPQDAEIHAVEDVRTRMIPELAAKGLSLQKSTAGQLNWEFQGPGNVGGRLRGLMVHPNNPNILYVGSVSGGVWKSMNGGASWSPTMNDLITLNVSALAMKPGDSNTIYAGTGEAYLTGDCLPGRGLLKTTDGGQTWKRIHVANGLNTPFITEIAVSPANPNVVYASGRRASPDYYRAPAETVPDPGVSAIFKSTDSGETWQDMTTGKGIEHDPLHNDDEYGADVHVSPTDANVVYATFGILAAGGIWKSTNGGQTWSRLTNGLPDANLPNLGYNRIELAMAPSNPNILYASFSYLKKGGDTVDLPNEAMLGLWKTTNGGQSWAQVTTPQTIASRNQNAGLITALGNQGTYGNAIIVHPNDPNIVFVGGLDIYKSIDGGTSWSQVSLWTGSNNPERLPHVHADHHVFAFDRSSNPPTLYNGSDGGIARSRDLGATWEILNNDLGVTQFYFFAAHPTNPNIMLGGSQDNGTPMLIDGGSNDWFDVTSGDGGPAHFDFNAPATVYNSVYFVKMYRSQFDYSTRQEISYKAIGFTDGSNGITQEDVAGADFFAPYEMSPNNPNVLVLGTNRLLKSTNRGDNWTALSTAGNEPIVEVAIAEGSDDIIWLATKSARIFKTEDGGVTYTNVTGTSLPQRYLTDIEFDPSHPRTVYLTYSGYGSPHVFKSTDAGGNWSDISNNLPDTPANTIQVHPQQPTQLFLGTDIGFFLSENGGQTWQPSTNGFPTTQVVAIVLNTNLNRIYAATHGRGVYSAQLGSSGTAVLEIDAQELALQARPEQTGAGTFELSNSGTADLSFNITTSGGQAQSGIGSASGKNARLPIKNAPLGTVLPAPSKRVAFGGDLFQNEYQASAKKIHPERQPKRNAWIQNKQRQIALDLRAGVCACAAFRGAGQ